MKILFNEYYAYSCEMVEILLERKTPKRNTEQENIDLIRKYKETRNIDARNDVIEGSMGLVYDVVKKMNISKDYNDAQDLGQIGFLALTNAIEAFDINRGAKFSVFAYKYIQGYILNAINKKTKKTYISLDKPITSSDDQSISMLDTLVSDPGSKYRKEDYKTLNKAMKKLDPRAVEMIKHYFGLMGDKKKTYRDIAKIYNMSQMGIKKIIDKNLKQLKKSFA